MNYVKDEVCTNKKENELRNNFIKYLLPSVTSMIVYSIYTMADGIFISWGVGPIGLAAVNIAMPFVNYIFAVSILFAVGTSTLTSIYLGKNNKKAANEIFTVNFVCMLVAALIITILTLSNLNRVAVFLGADTLTLDYVKQYIQITTMFNVCFILSYALEVLTKADGFPYLAIVGVVSSAMTNIILDYLFVIRFGWGIKGAAYATGISQLLAVIIYIIHFTTRSKLRLVKCKPRFSIVKEILLIGFPDFVTELSTGIVIYVFNLVILKLMGDDGVAIYGIISYINTLILMTMIGITQGMQPLCSQFYGKNGRESINDLLKMSAKMITVTSIAAFAIIYLFTDNIVNVFLDRAADEELFTYSIKAINIFSVSFLAVGYNILISGYFTAVAKPRYAVAISAFRGLAMILISLFVMVRLFGDTGIWLATPVSEFITFAISSAIFKKRS